MKNRMTFFKIWFAFVFICSASIVGWMLYFFWGAMNGNEESRQTICAMSTIQNMPGFCLKDIIYSVRQ